jgi:4-amino-4-deoxy-L-arabinose transferase-like glycosyltransferase
VVNTKGLGILLGVVLMALLVRLLFILPAGGKNLLTPWGKTNTDAIAYHQLATSLVEDRGFSKPEGSPTAFRPPLYPFFLSLAYRFFGKDNYLAVRVIQAALGTLTVVLLYMVSRELVDGTKGILIAALAAFYPFHIYLSSEILGEVLFIFFLTLALVFLLLSMSRHPSAYAVGAGCSLGVSSLGKPEIAAFIPFVMIWFFLVHRDWKRRILSVALLLVGFSLLVGPWVVRNYRTYGRVVPLSTNGGINFALGWDRAYLAQIGVRAPFHLDRTSSFGKQDEVERDRSYYGATWKAIAADPIAAIQVYLGKIVHFWDPALASVHPRFVRLVSLGTFSWVLLLGLTGLVKELFRGDRVRSSLFFMLFLCTTLVHALYLPNIRFRVATVDLYLLLFTGALLADLFRTLWTKASGQSPLLSRRAG